MSDIASYLGDKNAVSKKAKNIYMERYMKFVRLTTGQSNTTFFKAQCFSSYKKNVSYNIDIEIDKNAVRRCQCECAAGTGPYARCKHVCALLFGLSQFCYDRYFRTHETCTEKLLSFNRPKRFHGSPLKAHMLNLKEAMKSKQSIFREPLFDPRPVKFQKIESKYPDFFSNTIVNHAHIFPGMPILQTVPLANLHGYYNDHNYLTSNPEEHCLNELGVVTLSDDIRTEIEFKTRGQSQNDVWKFERTKRLQSSAFGRICKLTDRADKKNLVNSLLNPTEVFSIAINHGKLNEIAARQKFVDITGKAVSDCGLFVSKDYPYLAASPDGIVDEHTCLEIKCPYTAKDSHVTAETVPYLVMKEGALDLNKTHNYYYQVQGQMLCANRSTCDFVVYTFKDMKVIKVERDNAFIAEMISKLNEFFNTYYKPALVKRFLYKDFSL